MSRTTSSSQRNLTLPEELERLEQSITLTLQEIDYNFSKAHRIVTTSILPIVEQYAEQSKAVWEGSRFWKQFFESSANVSLSGYEEQPLSDGGQEGTLTEDSTTISHTSEDEPEFYATPSAEHIDLHRDEDLGLSSLTISPSQSTPRAKPYSRQESDDPTLALKSSLHCETQHQEALIGDNSQQPKAHPITPGKSPANRKGQLQNIAFTPSSSPFLPPASHMKPSTGKRWQKTTDPVLHRVFDKTYRIQATPIATSRKGIRDQRAAVATPKTSKLGHSLGFGIDSSPLSSPEIEAPKLHSEIFSSPIKEDTYQASRTLSKASNPKPVAGDLTPTRRGTSAYKPGIWDSDDDLNDEETALFGHSPPKTMQFHVPQGRLLKTPAKEASKRIVSDLLFTAGGGVDVTDEYDNSPSVIRRAEGLEDDTF